MSEKRYLDESAVTTFDATVEAAGPDGVVLDRTYFYPTGGGQPHDTGVLRGDGDGERRWRVVDVTGRETVRHVVEGEPRSPARRSPAR